MKFTGTFKNLKNYGYEFMKLYAMDYKVYNKKVNHDEIWIWVAQGGYIELNDWYQNTEIILNTIKSIDWDRVEEIDFMGAPEKYIYVRWNHDSKKEKCKLSKDSLESEYFDMIYKNNGMDHTTKEQRKEFKDVVYKEHDRDIMVFKGEYDELLSEIEKSQKC